MTTPDKGEADWNWIDGYYRRLGRFAFELKKKLGNNRSKNGG